jgi:hypothetical protein
MGEGLGLLPNRALSASVRRVLLKNVVLWDRPPPRSTGVPNLFGLFPLRCQSANGKAPNKLGIPTGEVFFNRIQETFGER